MPLHEADHTGKTPRRASRLAIRRDRRTRGRVAGAARRVTARFVAEGEFVVAGIPILATVFQELDTGAAMTPCLPEGAWTDAGATLAVVRGAAAAVLAGERVALNFVQ